MNADHPVGRRSFFRLAGGAGALAMLRSALASASSRSGQPNMPAATGLSDPRRALLEAIARDYLTIPKAEGEFLHMLVRLSRAKRVLELGTGYGYTTLWLALALEETGGKLTTVEIQPDRAALARQHLAQAGLAGRVRCHTGNAHALVPTLPGPFDVAYLDADKDSQVDYFQKLFPDKLPPGSLLVAHNAILRADAMKEYLDLVTGHPALDTVIVRAVPEDGFALSYRRRGRG